MPIRMFKIMFLLAVQVLFFTSTVLAEASTSQSHFSKFPRSSSLSQKEAIVSLCEHTPHKATCESTLLSSSFASSSSTRGVEGAFIQSVHSTIAKAQHARALAYNLTVSHRQNADDHDDVRAGGTGVSDCLELLDDAIDMLDNVMVRTSSLSSKPKDVDDDVHTWLSAALTNQETCLESLEKDKFKTERNIMDATAQNLSQYISNSLSLFVLTLRRNSASGSEHSPQKHTESSNSKEASPNRKLLSYSSQDDSSFPTWVTARERKLLEASVGEIEADAVVAKDGSGTHKSIGEALQGLLLMGSLEGTSDSGGRSVIQVKAGTYHEYINIPTKQKNVMLIGDGVGKTVIIGNRNSDDGWTTYKTATVAAMGDGFIARDITFVNNAGPSKHQAVALRVGADKSVVHRCSIVGYQDTLYTHSKRQFYRETDIYGTVDFIFGNSVVVFQNCNIYARKPASSGLKNFVTAQGRSSPDQNTGISIHSCKITAASDLAPVRSSYQTYLGRPWKQYSRTIVMQSFIDDTITHAGWSPWSGGFALNTLYYGEYMNSGSGASTSGRVTWGGYHASLTSTQAQAFTVGGFIAGNLWLPSTGVTFSSGLIG